MADDGQRSAIVTGASLGIGRAIAMRLGADGARVMLVGRDEVALQAACDEIRGRGGIGEYIAAALDDRSVAETIVAYALERFGRVDILVNCASATINGEIFAV